MRITKWKPYILRIIDILFALMSLFFAELVFYPHIFTDGLWSTVVIGAVAQATVFAVVLYVADIYKIMWYYASLQEMMRLILAVFFAQMVSFVIHMSVGTVFLKTIE